MKHPYPLLLKTGLCAALFAASGAFAQTTVGVTVTSAPTTSTMAAPTQDFATNIAKADLARQGIANPTSAELGAATTNVQGMRDAGMGWGAIANSLGLRLGDVVSAANKAKTADDARAASAEKSQKSAKTTTDKSRSTVASASVGVGVSQGGLGGNGGKGSGKGGGNGGGNGGGGGGGGGKR
jgi:hypothetical protein